VGVSDIAEYETKQLKAQDARRAQRRKLRELRGKLDAQLLFEGQRDFKAPLAKVPESLRSLIHRQHRDAIRGSVSRRRRLALALL
jgi:hypothetical protein